MKIGIIGGGASGMMAAISAKRKNPQYEVHIFERNEILGRKINATGNGRCNFTNLCFDKNFYFGEERDRILSILEAFSPNDTLDFFNDLGVLYHLKDTYAYPRSEQAATVVDAFTQELNHLGVVLHCNAAVTAVDRTKQGYCLRTEQQNFFFDKIIIASGSKANPKLSGYGDGYLFGKKLGLQIVPVLPALVQLVVANNPLKTAAKTRCYARVTSVIDQQEGDSHKGELQITDYGISGILVFQISRHISKALWEKKRASVLLDFMPEYTKEEVLRLLTKYFYHSRTTSCENVMAGFFHRKVGKVLLKQSGIDGNKKNTTISKKDLEVLLKNIKEMKLTITDTKGFDSAQICQGGISLKEINPQTMESYQYPGLYITGEVLDADGICGGYNLQWAWATGNLAGRNV
ncbi:putative Rossmann fold flavoprotein [Aequitasia blattaphilus]|uniref:NAD(P)/FAD-dependent oxidoreductase n=1 Tax=Aequitasia blattaphilus TaxID=2949332 RepID=A0ABT1E785_9FIRM|nr:NAD(P)/FAD-dependent oxidoreductase [Aequitasia blattaphilus]MCP1101689.1 NAD(P)/FAD-dependent oxidoreductase [Aequitasia blattaphilus]MCR8614329.1 NAD(P)/FAD-dependent oxidoreductase [Aequitasia blattaphilus]